MTTTPRHLTTTQAAARLGTSSEFVRKEIIRGRLTALKLKSPSGRRIYRISEVEFKRYCERYLE